MKSLKQFLQFAKAQLQRPAQSLTIVCGNESADFDSIACALTYAYYDNIIQPQGFTIPLINIARDDFKIRKDVVLALERLDIDLDHLWFHEDLITWRQRFNHIEAVLVDHNELVANTKDLIDEVIGIIDHHKDNLKYKNVQPRIIKPAGSCTSLVYQYMKKEMLTTFDIKDTCWLTLGALLLDTSNMKMNVESADLEVYQDLKSCLPSMGISSEEYYKELRAAKNDIDGLALSTIFKKDYKQFAITSAKGNVIQVGITSIVKPMEWILDRHQDSFESQCCKFLEEYDIDLLVLMTSWVDENQRFHRQLVLKPRSAEAHLEPLVLSKIRGTLKLQAELRIQKNNVTIWRQLETKASRKKVAPLIVDAIESIQTS